MCSDLPACRKKLSSVILSPSTCRYKLLNQPRQLALAACRGFTHTHTSSKTVNRPHRVRKHELLNKAVSQLETLSGKMEMV